MEDGRIWPPLIILALIVVGIFTFRYLEEVDEANKNLEVSKITLAQTQESLASRREMWRTLEAASLKFAQATKKQELAAQNQDEADKKQRLIEGDLKYLVNSMPTTVQKVREASVGVEFLELGLENGKVLKNAKLRKVDDTSITFLHSEGIGSIPIEELPKHLLVKFDLGDNSLVKRLQKLEASLTETTNTMPVKTDTPSQMQDSIGRLSAADAAKLKELKFRLADLQSKMTAAAQTKSDWLRHASNYTTQISINASRGVPTTLLREQQQKANAQAIQAQAYFSSLDAELKKTQVALEVLTNPTR